MILDTDFLDKYDITILHYRLCWIIAQNKQVNGWCGKGKKELAQELGVTEAYIFKMLRELFEKGLLEKHPISARRKLLRVTKLWDDEVMLMMDKIRELPANTKTA